MKAQDLMIGDFVAVNNTPLRIAALGTAKAGFIDAKGEMFYHYYDNIEPISLTCEILEKNGWWLGDAEHHLESLNVTIKLDYYFGNDFTIRYDSDNKLLIERGYDNGEMELQYVHELQHAMRLQGIEKQINL